MNPKVLALDEPTSNLRSHGRARSSSGCCGRLGGTQIIASHDLDLVRASSRTPTTSSSARRSATTWPSARGNCGCRRRKSPRACEASLAAVGLRGFEARSAFHMSFGEKKRVAIATVLSMNPKVLALDEPTSNLDPRSRKELIRLLRRLGGTQIIASHDLDLVRTLCDRAVLLSKGQDRRRGRAGQDSRRRCAAGGAWAGMRDAGRQNCD